MTHSIDMSPPSSRQQDVVTLTSLLRRSFGRLLSIELLTSMSLLLLLGIVGFSVSSRVDTPFLRYFRAVQPALVTNLDLVRILDDLVVFVAILPPLMWLLLMRHFTRSLTLTSRTDVALFLLRVASGFILSIALTVLVTECFSKRALLALVTSFYASLMLLYSWGVRLWKWYQDEVRSKGIVTFLPQSVQELLLHTSLFEWLTDSSFSDKVAPLLVFCLPLTRLEQIKLMEHLPPESQAVMTKPGMLSLLPVAMQKMLLAENNCDGVCGNNYETKRSHGMFETGPVGQLKTGKCQHTLMTEPLKASTSVSLTSAGFDFHRPDVVRTVHSPPSPGQLLNEIMASRMRDKCQELVKMPSSRTLDRMAAVSSALLVMQLYASQRSRKVFLTLVQIVSASALSSVACCAIFLRFVQLLDVRWNLIRAISLLHYVRPCLSRLTNSGTPQIDSQPARSGPVTVRTAATSVSMVVAALYVLRKLRR